MPESAPLNAEETAVGFELDTITVRDLAASRYARYHEWLDNVLGSAVPTSRIVSKHINPPITEEELEKRLKETDSELKQLEEEKSSGWNVGETDPKSVYLIEQIRRLRQDFGEETASEIYSSAEKVLGSQIVTAGPMRSVDVTYDRRAAEEQLASHQQSSGLDLDMDDVDPMDF